MENPGIDPVTSRMLSGVLPFELIPLLTANLSSSEVVSKCHICGEGENGDENWSGCPEINTQSIQILATSQALQLTPSTTTVYQTNRPVHIINT